MAAVKLRKEYTVTDYLGLKRAGLGQYLRWILLTFIFIGVMEVIQYSLKISCSDWMQKIYNSANHFTLFVLVIVLLMPILEELVFRGFLFKGFESRLDAFPTIALTAILWAMGHIQYESYFFIVSICIFGIILGVARWKTKSVYVPIALHVLNNGLSMAMMHWYQNFPK